MRGNDRRLGCFPRGAIWDALLEKIVERNRSDVIEALAPTTLIDHGLARDTRCSVVEDGHP